MKVRAYAISVLSALIAFVATGVALAQVAARSFTASPDIYKVVAQDEQYLVIEVTLKPGQRDQFHSHPSGGFFYYLTDCSIRFHTPDGTIRVVAHRTGDTGVNPSATSRSAENVGKSDCKQVLFEPK